MATESVATVSAYTLVNSAMFAGVSPVPMLKRAAILCDAVYVDTAGLGEPGSELEQRFLQKAFGGDSEHHDLLGDPRFRAMLRTTNDYAASAEQMDRATWEEAAYYDTYAYEVVESVPDDVLEPMAAPWRGVDYKTRGALANELTTDIARPDALRPWLGDPIGLITPLHTQVLGKAFVAEPRDPLRNLVHLQELGFADFGALSWERVMELRRSDFVHEFRAMLAELAVKPDGQVVAKMWQDLWKFAETHRPVPARTAIGGIHRISDQPPWRSAARFPSTEQPWRQDRLWLAVLRARGQSDIE